MKAIKKYFDVIVLGIILLSFILFFIPSGAFKYHNELSYKSNVYKMIFGFKDNGYAILNFNFLGFLIILLLVIVVVAILLKKVLKKYTYLISGALLLIATILCLLLPKTINVEMASTKDLFVALPFLYVTCVVMIIGAIVCLYKGIHELLKK